ncbi:MAG: AAA family ATPase [Bdellovibrionota bacterium]
MYQRLLQLPKHPKSSFFLWGPRQTGKSSLLKSLYPDALWINLLKNSEMMAYSTRPDYLTSVISEKKPRLVIIDEVQKVPALLDEVHSLIEDKKIVFGLCGSSARKLKRGQANLLGGRALRNELFGLVSAELGKNFNLSALLNDGYLPRFTNRLMHAEGLRPIAPITSKKRF